jgi:hypothetical protein
MFTAAFMGENFYYGRKTDQNVNNLWQSSSHPAQKSANIPAKKSDQEPV